MDRQLLGYCIGLQNSAIYDSDDYYCHCNLHDNATATLFILFCHACEGQGSPVSKSIATRSSLVTEPGVGTTASLVTSLDGCEGKWSAIVGSWFDPCWSIQRHPHRPLPLFHVGRTCLGWFWTEIQARPLSLSPIDLHFSGSPSVHGISMPQELRTVSTPFFCFEDLLHFTH